MPSERFIKELREFIKREGITQEKFGERVNLDQSTISRFLSGKQSPTVENLDRIASAMGRDVSEMLYIYLNRPVPDMYEMVSRAAALSSEKGHQIMTFARFLLLEEQQVGKEHEEPFNR